MTTMKIKKWATAVAGFLLSGHLMAQDPIFSQYNTAPLQISPSLTGAFKGQSRFMANYRQQWGGIFSDVPIRTIQAAGDFKFNVADQDYLAFGLSALEDESGADSKFKSTKGHLSVAYHKQLGGNRYRRNSQYLVLGAQIGGGQFSAQTSGLWFDRQYDSATISVDKSLPSGEPLPQSAMMLDVNASLMWYFASDNDQSMYVGVAAHHLNSPSVTFLGVQTETIKPRFVGHIGGEIPAGRYLSFLPSAMSSIQGPYMTSLAGTGVRYSNRDWREVALRAGMSYRLTNKYIWKANKNVASNSFQDVSAKGISGDALVLTGGIEIEGLFISGSYDIHTSGITRATNGRGAWELSVIYTPPVDRQRGRFYGRSYVPRF